MLLIHVPLHWHVLKAISIDFSTGDSSNFLLQKDFPLKLEIALLQFFFVIKLFHDLQKTSFFVGLFVKGQLYDKVTYYPAIMVISRRQNQ